MSDAEALTRQFVQAEGEQVVRDFAGHLGDQIFDTLKRNGMMMRSVAGAVGALTLSSAMVLNQAGDFLRRSLADDSDGEPSIEASADEAQAIAMLFLVELSEDLRLAVAGRAWQSIETAPEWDGKSGPFIDVAWTGFTHRYLPIPRRETDCFCEDGVIMRKHGYPSVLTIFDPQPTHWMPAPPAPPGVDVDSAAA